MKKSNFAAMILIGMCLVMIWSNLILGIAIGIVGIAALLCLIPFIKGLE